MTETRTAQSDQEFRSQPFAATNRTRVSSDLPRWVVYLAFAGFCAAVWALALLAIFLVF